MPLHPIFLHFHVAAFLANIIVLIILAFIRLGVTPNLIEEQQPTRSQRVFQGLDWIIIITIILGLLMSILGIITGFVELATPPEIGEHFVLDIYMQIKICTSFIYMALYAFPLLFRFKYGQMMWKSKGMSLTYIIFICLGFFFLLVTTFLGSYYTSYLMPPLGNPVELSKQFIETFWWLFIPFGVAADSTIDTYVPGMEIELGMVPLMTTLVIILDLFLICFISFYSFRTWLIKKYNNKFNIYKINIMKGLINKDSPAVQNFLKEMLSLKIKVKNI